MKAFAAYGLGALWLVLVVLLRITSTDVLLRVQEEIAPEAPEVVTEDPWLLSRLEERPFATVPIPATGHSAVVEEATETNVNLPAQDLQAQANSVPDDQLRSALEMALGNPNETAMQFSQLLVQRWAGIDPLAAAAWAEQLGSTRFQGEALRQVGIAWANTDAAAAYDWINTLPEGVNREEAMLGVAYEASRTEPVVALEMGRMLAPGPERDELLVHAVRGWGASDFNSAKEWATSVPDPGLRGRLLAAVAVDVAEQDGALAAGLVATLLPAGQDQERSAVAITQRWAEKAPQEAASWVAKFPEGAARTFAMQNIATVRGERGTIGLH
jgi:hypothetical protein